MMDNKERARRGGLALRTFAELDHFSYDNEEGEE